MPHALIVDDDANCLAALAGLVESEGFTVSVASSFQEARRQAEVSHPDLVLADVVLGDGTGLDLLGDTNGGRTALVLVTAHASVETAVAALRHGATDYLTKPVDVTRLKKVLGNVRRARELRGDREALREESRRLGRIGPLVGESPPMRRVYDLIARVAPTEASVLLVGESGTGKDLVADTVHALSRRRGGPFLPLNCGAVPPNLIETELFGHERGSFTGAERTHRGHFERAAGGTVFLDEISEMPYELQVKLLRVLETGSVLRVGGERPVPVDVRVIAASNLEPEDAVARGKLRADLLYRLRVFPLRLPPLRERGPDVEILAQHFLDALNTAESAAKRFTSATFPRLRAHPWPGNVRELKNLVQQAFILSDAEVDLFPAQPAPSAGVGPTSTPLDLPVGLSLREAQRRFVLATLEQCGGNKRQAAAKLGISLKTLYNRLKAYRSQ